MSNGQSFFERDQEGIARALSRGECAEPGPWGTVCTSDPGHRYAHYDSGDDSSWTDDWPDWAPDEDDEEQP